MSTASDSEPERATTWREPAESLSVHDVPPPVAVPAEPSAPFLGRLDELLDFKAVGADRRPDVLAEFLSISSPASALAWWLRRTLPAGALPDRRTIARLLNRDIARLDTLLSAQVNAILHHPRFQSLEASWRGLKYLVDRPDVDGETIKVRVLNASWKDLARDAERAVEFDQSQLFRKVYEDEFGSPGGEPFGILIGDYYLRHRPTADHPIDDVGLLGSISQVAAAAFAPFIGGVDPAMLGLESFSRLEQSLNLARSFEDLDYLKWRALRDREDARFVGLAIPRVLMRLPHDDSGRRTDGFRFREDVSGLDREKYLWGNAAFAFAAVVIRAVAEGGWMADIRGVQRGVDGGGLVTGLPCHWFATDAPGVALKTSTEVVVNDFLEKDLSLLGFVPLCAAKDTEYSVFYSNQSVQKPQTYDEKAATVNARVSSMLQYMLCVSRFAHYLKVLARDKVGSTESADQLQDRLARWVSQYVAPGSNLSPDVKAQFPLKQADVQVREQPGKPGSYMCVMRLAPHFQLDQLDATLRLVTELSPVRPG